MFHQFFLFLLLLFFLIIISYFLLYIYSMKWKLIKTTAARVQYSRQERTRRRKKNEITITRLLNKTESAQLRERGEEEQEGIEESDKMRQGFVFFCFFLSLYLLQLGIVSITKHLICKHTQKKQKTFFVWVWSDSLFMCSYECVE